MRGYCNAEGVRSRVADMEGACACHKGLHTGKTLRFDSSLAFVNWWAVWQQ